MYLLSLQPTDDVVRALPEDLREIPVQIAGLRGDLSDIATRLAREIVAIDRDLDGACHTADLIRSGAWDTESSVRAAILVARVALSVAV